MVASGDSFVVGVDIGGTFTDAVAVAPDGELCIGKVLTTPPDFSEGFFAAIAAAAAARPSHPRVFYELGDTPDLYGPSDDFFGVELIRLAGGIPITTGDPVSFTMPLERLVAADPEVIVLGDAAYGTTADAVAHRSGWEGLTAVRTGAIRPVDDTIVTRPGPRLADGLAALARAIDPGLQLP